MAEYKLTDDDVIEEAAKSIADMIMKAKVKALKEGIKANTVFIDKNFAKVNAFSFVFNYNILSLPPMICGLEIQPTDELPDGYDFAVFEAPETERERLYKKAKAEAASEIFEEIEEQIDRGIAVITKILNAKGGRANGKTVLLSKYDVFIESKKYIAELKKKYTEGEI